MAGVPIQVPSPPTTPDQNPNDLVLREERTSSQISTKSRRTKKTVQSRVRRYVVHLGRRPLQRKGSQPQQSFHKSEEQTPNSAAYKTTLIHCPSPLQRLPVNGTRMDPFTELPIPAKGIVPAMVDYFVAICKPEKVEVFTVHGHSNPHLTLLYPFMLGNRLLFEAVMVMCRAAVLNTIGTPHYEDRALLFYRARVMKGITSALSTDEGVSDTVLLSVSMLLTTEFLLGNRQAVAAHKAGIQKMLEMRPDLDADTPWNRFVKAGVATYKSLGSFVDADSPYVPRETPGTSNRVCPINQSSIYPRNPFSPELCSVLANLPRGFTELALAETFSLKTIQTLTMINQATTLCEAQELNRPKLDKILQALLSNLQQLSTINMGPSERLIICGVLAHVFQLRNLQSLNLFHDPPLLSFIKIVPAQERVDIPREQASMVWVSVVVAGALNLRPVRLPGSHLVLDRLFQLYPNTLAWETTEGLLRSFFWTTTLLEHWRKAHKAGKARWKQVLRARQNESRILYAGSISPEFNQDIVTKKTF